MNGNIGLVARRHKVTREEEEWGTGEPLIQILPVSAMSHTALDWSSLSLSRFLDFKLKGV